MQNIIISPTIKEKLWNKHAVTPAEVYQCFENQCGSNLIDDRENHRTDPETLWFISTTNNDRLLKIIFI